MFLTLKVEIGEGGGGVAKMKRDNFGLRLSGAILVQKK